MFTEPAGGLTIAVLQKLMEEGNIDKDETVVCYITGNGLKSTEAIMNTLPKINAVKPDIRLVSALIS